MSDIQMMYTLLLLFYSIYVMIHTEKWNNVKCSP